MSKRSPFTRIFAGAAVTLSLVLSASFLAAGPALAVSVGTSGLPYTAGHTCVNIDPSLGTEGLCVELAVYWSASGQASAVAQVEGFCSNAQSTAPYEQCSHIEVVASGENTTTAKAGTATDATCGSGSSTPCVKNGRTYFVPMGGIHIAANSCAYNVWATVFAAWVDPSTGITHFSNIDDPDAGSNQLYPANNLGTPHYNVCLFGNSATFSPV